MNLIKMKTRNQLSNINVDKLMYIYINECMFNRPWDLKKKLRYTQSIEIDEKKLLNMKDRLLQKKVAMTRLNSSNDEMLKDFLNSIVNDEMTMKHSTNWCYLYIPLCLKHASINMFKTIRILFTIIWHDFREHVIPRFRGSRVRGLGI